MTLFPTSSLWISVAKPCSIRKFFLVVLLLLTYKHCYWHGMLRSHLQDSRSETTWTSTTQVEAPSVSRNPPWMQPNNLGATTAAISSLHTNATHTRYLVFRPPLEAAQGIGNMMHGLLAAHLLGNEFDRVVCVSPEWKDFWMAWEYNSSKNNSTLLCTAAVTASRTPHNTLWLLNFAKLPANQCKLRQRLRGSEAVLYFVANTYPSGWPTLTRHTQSTGIFQDLYRPRGDFWNQQEHHNTKKPPIVVHLRAPDDPLVDPRPGLDETSLHALGTHLNHLGNHTSSEPIAVDTPPFLVTNQPSLYEYFDKRFGWKHHSDIGMSDTAVIVHSAHANLQWGSGSNSTAMSTTEVPHRRPLLQQLWRDWWTIHEATTAVYLTKSDFSLSAIHWSGILHAYILTGDAVPLEKTGTLSSTKETNSVPMFASPPLLDQGDDNQAVVPFSQRRIVRNCHLDPSGLDGMGYAMNLDDEFSLLPTS